MSECVQTGGKYVSEEDVSELQFRILKILEKEGKLSRYAIMSLVDRSSSTVHENLIKLVQKGLINEQIHLNEKKGRPAYFFELRF